MLLHVPAVLLCAATVWVVAPLQAFERLRILATLTIRSSPPPPPPKSLPLRVHFPGGAPRPQPGAPPPRLLLSFKKFLFDDNKRRMAQ